MKTVFSALNGAVLLTEDGGVFTLALSEAASVGGGQAAGVLKVQGSGSVVLDVPTGVALGEKILNSHLPLSLQPAAVVIEGVANSALKALA